MNEELKAILAHLEHGFAMLKAHLTPGAIFTPHQKYPKSVTYKGVTHIVGSEKEESDFLAEEAALDDGGALPDEPAHEPAHEPEATGFAAHVAAEDALNERHDEGNG